MIFVLSTSLKPSNAALPVSPLVAVKISMSFLSLTFVKAVLVSCGKSDNPTSLKALVGPLNNSRTYPSLSSTNGVIFSWENFPR